MKKETELCFPVYSSPPKLEGDAPHLGGLDWCQHTNGTIGLMAEHINRMPTNLHNKQQKRNSIQFTIQFNSRSILIESNSHGRSNVQRFTLGTNHSTTPCRPSHNNNDSDHPRSPDTLCCTTNHSFLPHQALPFTFTATFTATAASKSNQQQPEEHTETNSSI